MPQRLIVRRIPRLVRRACLATCLAASFASSSTALAAPPFADISSSGPLTHVYVGNELSCQVAHVGDASLELYPPNIIPGDCGSFLAVLGTGLFAPDFGTHVVSATASLGAYTPFTPVSQSPVTGSGTASDPFKVVTVVDAGSTGLRLTETDSYVVGQGAYRTDVVVSNTASSAQDVILYRAGDCFLQNSDFGFGFVELVDKSVGCSATANNSPPGRIEEWVPITGGNNYYEAQFNEVWAWIGSQLPFPDTCRCGEFIDNGAGLSWSFSVPAGASVTRSHFTVFSPLGIDVSVGDATVTEGDSGTVNATFTVSLSRPSATPVTVDFATADGTATAPGDYASTSGTLTFAPGETSKAVTTTVNGDTVCEVDESFFLNLSNATGATIVDGQGQGTILNDDSCVPDVSINDVSVTEGNSGVTNATFTVTLSQTTVNPVSVDFATADGTATAPSDYAATAGTLAFAPGDLSKTVTVPVNGDLLFEPDETFVVNLTTAVGASIADGQGQGTILNDDPAPPEALDHFKCYTARGMGKHVAGPVVVLQDQFETERVVVGKATSFCNPVDKNKEGISDPTAHLSCYKIRHVKGDGFLPFTKREVQVENQFGKQTLKLKRSRTLCAPSSKSLTQADPGPPPTKLDHFKCYQAKGEPLHPTEVTLTDQFGTSESVVRRPVLLCTPVSKNDEGIQRPDQHLVCYQIKPREPVRRSIRVGNQFGLASLRVKRAETLCAPSTKTVALPDLTVAIPHQPIPVTCTGTPVTCTTTVVFTVSNIGAGAIPAGSTFDVLLEADPLLSVSKTVTITVSSGGLPPGGSLPMQTEVLPPSGNCYDPDCTIRAIVDSANQVSEANEGNNVDTYTHRG
jgi:Calx-beta domain/CARDB